MADTDGALQSLNTRWQASGLPFAVASDSGWTISCPSCSIVTEATKTLVSALNQAIIHRRYCQSVPADG